MRDFNLRGRLVLHWKSKRYILSQDLLFLEREKEGGVQGG